MIEVDEVAIANAREQIRLTLKKTSSVESRKSLQKALDALPDVNPLALYPPLLALEKVGLKVKLDDFESKVLRSRREWGVVLYPTHDSGMISADRVIVFDTGTIRIIPREGGLLPWVSLKPVIRRRLDELVEWLQSPQFPSND